jgi:uncharacterized phiE125 gp8 family phage protein
MNNRFHNLRSTLARIVEPTIEPVTIALLKKHARVGDCNDEDVVYERYLKLGREMVETDLQRALITQTWQLHMDRFPSDAIELRICPVQSVTSVTYVDGLGVTQTWSPANYIANVQSEPGRIALAYGQAWPVARCQENSVTVTFVAGYGGVSSVPERACQAIRLLAAEAIISREAVGTLVDEQMANYRAIIDRIRWSGYR